MSGASRIRALRARLRLIVNAYRNVPCMDCGNTFPVYCMDFDHVRGKKVDDVTQMVNRTRPINRILEEIEKCEVVCSNCHRIRHTHRSREMAAKEPPLPLW